MNCSSNGIPICFFISTANVHDSKYDNLFEILSRVYFSTIIFTDKGYDSSKLIDSADRIGISLICPINKRNTKKLKVSNMSKLRFRNYEFLSSPSGKKLYKKCWEIELLFGNLKENNNINNHHVRAKSKIF